MALAALQRPRSGPPSPQVAPAVSQPKFLEPALTWTFADLLIDCEEDRTLRAVVVGLLAEMAPEVAALTPRVGPNGYLRRRPLPLGHDDESVVFLND